MVFVYKIINLIKFTTQLFLQINNLLSYVVMLNICGEVTKSCN